MEKENTCISDGIKYADLSLHYIVVWSARLSKIGLLNIDYTTTASIGRRFGWFFFSCPLHGKPY